MAKDINSKSVLKEDYEYLKSLHNAVCGAIAKHNFVNIEPNQELLKKQAHVERIMMRMKNIIEFGVHDKELIPLIKPIESPTLFS
ncbi:hypothetical protein [Flectobacillus roseus]|uniref:hypothetical protein n=1 Tax=Flectobacillus roseus TaxID=502259 RepID=UPI0024B7AA54|nr:hypothetical protein [Flectobacillus roseus]MDI9872250.1 hypothetical protein [Flectobacillus roseus]